MNQQDASGGLEEFSLWVPKGYVMAGYPTLLEFQFMTADRPQFALGTGTEISDIRIRFTKWVLESRLVRACEEGEDYRFGFNGGEKINEIAGLGNHVDLGERGVDTRTGRLGWRPDPLAKSFASLSPYAFAQNSPIAMIDNQGRHGEIVINKAASHNGTKITKVDVNVVLLTTATHSIRVSNDMSFIDYAKHQVRQTYGRKEFSGDVDGKVYNASFNITIKSGLSNEQLQSQFKSNPVSNKLDVNATRSNGSRIGTVASDRWMNYSTTQRSSYPNSFAHEISHLLGADGDGFSGKDYMSDYSGGRQVQDAEVNELLAPALRLAERVGGDNITIHFFNKTDKYGNETKGEGRYNTYKVYDSEKNSYTESETVPVINPR